MLPAASLACLTWFALICAYACFLVARPRALLIQARLVRLCVMFLSRVMHMLLFRAVFSGLSTGLTPSIACVLAYAVVWVAARHSRLAHGSHCRF